MEDQISESYKQEVVQVARQILDGQMGIIAGSRAMYSLCVKLNMLDDPDFRTFRLIESESDTLPVGPERATWATDALIEKDQKIQKFEAFYRDDALEAARNLIRKFTD